MATSTQIFVYSSVQFISILKPEAEGCHSVFNQSSQFIFSHILTSDKLEPF